MVRERRDVVTSVSALFGLLPGFLFPFVLATTLGARSSDFFLLATAASLTLTSIIGSAVEMNSIGEVGRLFGRGVVADRQSVRSYQRRILIFVVTTTAVVGPALIALYSLSGSNTIEFWTLGIVVLLVPAVGGMASIRSGQVIAQGRAAIAIALQSARSVPPLGMVVFWPSVPLLGLAFAFVGGECIRLVALTLVARRLDRLKPAESVRLRTRGLVAQSAATATANGSPATDRSFLGGQTGGVTAFELADKLFFAAVQFLNLGFLVRRVGEWSRLPVRAPATGRAVLRKDSIVLFVVTSALALIGAVVLAAAPSLPLIPEEWHTGFVWAAILLASLPLSMGITVISRLLIIARRQSVLFWLSFMSFVINALLDWALFVAWGPVGIPIATVLARALAVLVYVVVARRVIPKMLGADLGLSDVTPPMQKRRLRGRVGIRVFERFGVPAVFAVVTVGLCVVAVASPLGAVAVVAIIAMLLLWWLPAWSLPSIALFVFAFVPIGYIVGVPEPIGRYIAPAVVIMLVWLLRTARNTWRGDAPAALVFWPAILLILLFFQSLYSVQPPRSFLWVVVFAIAALVPALHARAAGHRTVKALTTTWLAVGCVLSVLAIIESVVRFNPLAQHYTVEQTWSIYRVTTTLGHPLMNATFFSATACLALFIALRRGSHQRLALCAFLLSGIAASLSGSRSAIVALAVGLGVGLVALVFSRRVSFAAKLVTVVASLFAVATVASLPIFAERSDSAEARSSSQYREFTLQLANHLIEQNPLFGGGPSTSVMLAIGTGAPHPLENAILGTIVSIGIVGSLCLAVFLLWLGVRAIRAGRIEALAALASFLTSGAAFPLWESVAASFVVVGLLAIIGAVPDAVIAKDELRSRSLVNASG